MSSESVDENVVSFAAEKGKRTHDLNEKRLLEVRSAFEKAFPLKKSTRKKARKPKKKP